MVFRQQLPGIYSITKGAVINMTKAFAKECAQFGIRCNALLPGLTDTKFASALVKNDSILQMALQHIPLSRVAQPSEMAGAVLYGQRGIELHHRRVAQCRWRLSGLIRPANEKGAGMAPLSSTRLPVLQRFGRRCVQRSGQQAGRCKLHRIAGAIGNRHVIDTQYLRLDRYMSRCPSCSDCQISMPKGFSLNTTRPCRARFCCSTAR